MASLDPTSSFPALKSFPLTHILYNPLHPSYLTIPLTLISLSPIFLFVSYLTLLIFTRRLTIILLASGQIGNEVLSLLLKRAWKGDRPYKGLHDEVGRGYGMPSSHSQAAGFLAGWGVGYWMVRSKRNEGKGSVGMKGIDIWRERVWVFGLVLWSVLVAFSRWYLLYHTPYQIIAGYLVGIVSGTTYFIITEYIPLYHPNSPLSRLRQGVAWVWEGIGGIGGHGLGDAPGGWGEGHFTTSVKATEPVERKDKAA